MFDVFLAIDIRIDIFLEFLESSWENNAGGRGDRFIICRRIELGRSWIWEERTRVDGGDV